jgi:hypothetical protein
LESVYSTILYQRWNRSEFLTTDTGLSRSDRTEPADLKFIPEPLLYLDNDKWRRELRTKAVYLLSGRYSWDPVEVLYIFTWKKQNFNYNRRPGLSGTGTCSISVLYLQTVFVNFSVQYLVLSKTEFLLSMHAESFWLNLKIILVVFLYIYKNNFFVIIIQFFITHRSTSNDHFDIICITTTCRSLFFLIKIQINFNCKNKIQ